MDISKYTEKEIAALSEKEKHPDNFVLCPRCGTELIYRAVGNSYQIKCKSQDCIKRTVRGI